MPTTDDFGQGVSIASLTDAPDAAKLARDIVNGIAARSVMRFASASARSAALTAPAEGMTTWLVAEGRLEIYHIGSWLAWPPPAVQTFQVSDAPYNQTQVTVDYSVSAWPRAVFVAPPSGRAYVTVSAGISNTNTDTSTIWAAWRATGNLGFAYTNLTRTGLSAQGRRVVGSRRLMLTGMTAGETITVIPQWNISSGGASTSETFGGALLVEPAP
ncbi:hypothetical protein AB0D49_08125 [Streptomyces sp. NPDC048290]|uniref:hypothetical protein n=1 Tax=Streptomyces sp. NPDC048290 TaxID=3155811 RepID=UPI003436BCF8